MPFATWLRTTRQAAGLSQAQLADRCGLSVRAIRDLERGRVRTPQQATEKRLVEALEGELSITIAGPLEVRKGDTPIAVTSPRRRALLGYLCLYANQTVPVDKLLETVWPDRDVPAVEPLHQEISRLRRLLRGQRSVRIDHTPGGYRLVAEPEAIDLPRLRARLREAGALAEQRHLTRAYAIWDAVFCRPPGQLLADLPQFASDPAVQAVAAELARAAIAFGSTATTLGRADRAVDPLLAALRTDPLDESVCAAAMRTLAAAGRPAAALDLYRQTRRGLSAELGIEPSADLQRTYEELLAATGAEPAPGTGAPAQLPADVPDFVGRASEVDRIRQHLAAAGGAAPALAVVTAAGGFGKTALAVHVAHRIRDRYPDGQLFIQLRGASGQPVEPADALASLLYSLGARDIPTGLDDRVRLFRTLLDGRQMLLVLDDAGDTAQVRPLVPGSPSCAVLVTSRRNLAGLPGAESIGLRPLEPTEAVDLLARITGVGRVAVEPDAATSLAAACGGLPLAVRIAGGRLAARPSWPLATFAGRLADSSRRLDELRLGDLAVRASLQLGYEALPADQAMAFRAFGSWPDNDIPLEFAAALLAMPVSPAEDLLEALVDVHLLDCPEPGRYRIHDLLHTYAAERRAEDDSASVREEAVVRVMAFSSSTVEHALAVIYPNRTPERPEDHRDSPHQLRFDAYADARGWLDRSFDTLVLLVRHQAAERGPGADTAGFLALLLTRYCQLRGDWRAYEQIARLGLALATYTGDERLAARIRIGLAGCLDNQYRSTEAAPLHHSALAYFRGSGDRLSEARVLINLGSSYGRQQRYTEAEAHFSACLRLATELGDRQLRIRVLINFAETLNHTGDYPAARRHAELAVDLCEESDEHVGRANAMSTLGETLTRLGDHTAAARTLAQALELARQTGDRGCEAETSTRMAALSRQLGDYRTAIGHAQWSLGIYDQNEDLFGRAETLNELGRIFQQDGQTDNAVRNWRAAAAIFADLGAPEAAAVAGLLEPLTAR